MKMWLNSNTKATNEKQHIFNEEVRNEIESVTKALSATPPAVEKAMESLKEGEKLITAKQKLG